MYSKVTQLYIYIHIYGFLGDSVKNLRANAGDAGSVLGLGRSREKEMVTDSSILAWESSWTEQSGGLQSMGSQIVRHNLQLNNNIHVYIYSFIFFPFRLKYSFLCYTVGLHCLSILHIIVYPC